MKVKLIIAAILCNVGALAAYSQAASSVHNGFWWLEQSETLRLGYVIGFADGAGQGNFLFNVASTSKGNTVVKPSKDWVNSQLDFTGIRFAQFKDGLDEFYKDYKNKAIHIDDAFGYVRDSIKGVNQKELTRDLETLRKLAVEPGYDPPN